jgi:O-antigen ligase
MFSNKKKNSLYNLINFLFYMLPVSFVIGSLVININLSLFLILSIAYIKKNKLRFNFNYTNVLLICFFIYIIFATLLNIKELDYEYLIKAIFLLRFLILYLVVEILLTSNHLKLKYLFYSSLITVSFVSIDIITQYILGYNLFGFMPWEGRIAGIFTSEGIGGSYIQKFSLFAIFGSLLFFQRNRSLIFFSLVVLVYLAIFVSSNKMSFILINTSILILLLFGKNYRSLTALAFATSVMISIFLILVDSSMELKYKAFYKNIITTKTIEKNIDLNKTEIKTIEKKTINLYSHTRIYFTAIESWKNRLVLGNGHKSFRIICKNILQKKKNLACSTHPHNYHLEILHDYGLIGFVIILMFTLIKLYQLSRSYFSNNNNEKFKLFFLPISILFLIEIWPIKSTGMLLTTWNGTIVWLIISLTSIYTLSKKN